MSFRKVQVGSVVKLVNLNGYDGPNSHNPLWGSKRSDGSIRRVYGTVTRIGSTYADVKSTYADVSWDNGRANDYLISELVVISDRKDFLSRNAKNNRNHRAASYEWVQLDDISGQALYEEGAPSDDLEAFINRYGFNKPITDFEAFMNYVEESHPCWADWLEERKFIEKEEAVPALSANEDDYYDIGDRVKHPKSGREYMITAINDNGEAVVLVNPATGNRLKDALFYTEEVHAIPKADLHAFLGYDLIFVPTTR